MYFFNNILFWKKRKKNEIDIFHYMTPDEFYNIYKYCPRCGNSNFIETHVKKIRIKNTDFVDNVNSFRCKVCGYKGKRNELISYDELNRRLRS